ncbi:MAG: hypothetical protein JSV62_09175 [Promethearchaeota archaeon]|nr:MAG: hypothetical protein JSV62_09175 [Candidatus Lokiarchaeota archaeon]
MAKKCWLLHKWKQRPNKDYIHRGKEVIAVKRKICEKCGKVRTKIDRGL